MSILGPLFAGVICFALSTLTIIGVWLVLHKFKVESWIGLLLYLSAIGWILLASDWFSLARRRWKVWR